MIELCCEWLYVIIMSQTSFRVNLHSICLTERQETSGLMQVPYLKFKWQQLLDSSLVDVT